MTYEDYSKLLYNSLNAYNGNKNTPIAFLQVGYELFNDNSIKLNSELEELKKQLEEQKEICKELKNSLKDIKKPSKKKVKKPKYNKRIEKKVIDLIITYRKTTKEIKNILQEENKIILSDRTINEIKKNNNIRGHKIIQSEQK